jgi:hypothetical protein
MQLNKSLYGSANRISDKVKPKRIDKRRRRGSTYINRLGKLIKATGVPQLPDHINRHITAGLEPTEEMQLEAARTIEAATAKLRAIHLAEM